MVRAIRKSAAHAPARDGGFTDENVPQALSGYRPKVGHGQRRYQ